MKPIRYTRAQVLLMIRVAQFFGHKITSISPASVRAFNLQEQEGEYIWLPK